jgi:transcriptional regulator with XRE-family HTH domain
MNSQNFFNEMVSQLNRQKRELGISFSVLSGRTGISEPTLKRIFSGQHNTAHLEHVLLIADALGVAFSMRLSNPEKIRRKQAEKKAKYIMSLVRGNSALEDQSVSKRAYDAMMEKTVTELLSGSNKQLWAE